MTLDQFLQSPVLLAIAGAVAGGLRAGVMSWRKNGKLRAFSDGLIGMVFAVGMADWLTPPAYPKAAALIGLLAGTTGARALDAFFELAPELVRDHLQCLALVILQAQTWVEAEHHALELLRDVGVVLELAVAFAALGQRICQRVKRLIFFKRYR